MVLGQHRRMWLEAMRQTEQRVYGFGILKDVYALVGIHLRKEKCCLKKGTTSVSPCPQRCRSAASSTCLSDWDELQTTGQAPLLSCLLITANSNAFALNCGE